MYVDLDNFRFMRLWLGASTLFSLLYTTSCEQMNFDWTMNADVHERESVCVTHKLHGLREQLTKKLRAQSLHLSHQQRCNLVLRIYFFVCSQLANHAHGNRHAQRRVPLVFPLHRGVTIPEKIKETAQLHLRNQILKRTKKLRLSSKRLPAPSFRLHKCVLCFRL